MKKIGALIVSALLFAACASAEPVPLTELDVSVAIGFDERESLTDDADFSRSEPKIPIKWGINIHMPNIFWGQFNNTQSGGAVADYLEERFSVALSYIAVFNPYERAAALAEAAQTAPPNCLDAAKREEVSGLGDIFYENPFRAYGEGLTRTIPREMVERHAPRYAALLDAQNGWGIFMDGDDLLGLSVYDAYHGHLNVFSAYRLDWLREIGIEPKGTLIPAGNRIYFTAEPFSQDEFTHIMRSFSVEGLVNQNAVPQVTMQRKPYGLEATSGGLIEYTAPIMGMWGVNNFVMEENNRAVPFYISQPYKSALAYLASLGPEVIFLENIQGRSVFHHLFQERRKGGWISAPISNLLITVENMLDKEFFAEVLITPPEIAGTGMQGAGMIFRPFNHSMGWVIKNTVDDAKLAKILELFDAISLDPEVHIIAKYGFEGEHFTWEGEPYDSMAVPNIDIVPTHMRPSLLYWFTGQAIGLFDTGMMDGITGKRVFDYGNSPVTEFAAGEAARRMVIPPFKDDPLGVLNRERWEINWYYGLGLQHIMAQFAYDVIASGQPHMVDLHWDAYINDLMDNGLNELLDLYARFGG
jgi:hypothetical protein